MDAVMSLTTSGEYVINGHSGKIHHRFRASPESKTMADYPQCNLDQIVKKVKFDTREEVAHWFEDRRLQPKACLRCFPEPDEEDEVHTDEGPSTSPEVEVMPLAAMDPEDRPST